MSKTITTPAQSALSLVQGARTMNGHGSRTAKQDQESLQTAMSLWLKDLEDTGGGSRTDATYFRLNVVGLLQKRMNANAATRENGPRTLNVQDRLQRNFWLDETVAHELDISIDSFLGKPDSSMDKCTFWCIMHRAIEELKTQHQASMQRTRENHLMANLVNGGGDHSSSSTTDSTENDACNELFMALVRAFPQYVFQLNCPGSERGCKHADRRTSVFNKAIEKGLPRLVKYMIDQCLSLFSQTTRNNRGAGCDANTKLTELLILDDSFLSSIQAYRKTETNSNFEILEEFLKLDEDGHSKIGLRRDPLVDDATLTTTMKNIKATDTLDSNPLLRVSELILKYRSDLKTTEVIKKALGRANPTLAMLVLSNTEIDKSVATHMIELGLEDIWALSPVQHAVAHLLQDNKTARELFGLALRKSTSSLPPGGQLTLFASSKDRHVVARSGEEQPEFAEGAEDEEHQPRFAGDILQMMGSLDSDTRDDIVKSGSLWFWKLPYVQALWQEEVKKDRNLCMLHTAVQHQQVEFVEYFLHAEPDSVLKRVEIPMLDKEDKSVYALWHNNYLVPEGPQPLKPVRRPIALARKPESTINRPKRGSEFVSSAWRPASSTPAKENQTSQDLSSLDTRARIRKLLIPAIIERTSGMNSLVRILRESEERAGLVCFDISSFTPRLSSVGEFIRSLCGDPNEDSDQPDSDSDRHLKFEEVLRYADFPSLDLNPGDANAGKMNNEVFDALRWLRRKGVRRILSLRVLDRMHQPHDERTIAIRARSMGVEKLDWRFLDMAISYLADTNIEPRLADKLPRETLKELHLYSSGKRAAVDHWLGQNGVRTLRNLKVLYIHLIQDLITEPLMATLRKIISEGIVDINKKRGEASEPEIKLQFVEQPWNSSLRNHTKDLKEIAKRAVPELYKYIAAYSDRILEVRSSKTGVRRTRVAILDSGILAMPPLQAKKGENNGLWPRIAEGESFIDDTTRLAPWQFASDPHGTQIANIISAIDPHCEIYVAKVTEGRHGIMPDDVADAIMWAKRREVDVISMSLAIPQHSHNKNEDYAKALKQAVIAADGDDIVQFCSHDDEGWNADKSWPADCGHAKIIVACNKYGAFIDREPRKYHYQIPGIDIFTGAVPYLESKDTMSGSSVATAIAAGLSSLVLSCYRLQHGPESKMPYGRRRFVEDAFADMSVYVKTDKIGESRYLRLEDFSKFAKSKEHGTSKYSWFV